MNFASLRLFPSFTSGAIQRYSFTCESLTGTLPRNHRGGRREKDLDVEPERARPRISKIEAYHLVERRAAATGDLPQAGESGFRFQDSAPMPRLVVLEFVIQRRSRSNQ